MSPDSITRSYIGFLNSDEIISIESLQILHRDERLHIADDIFISSRVYHGDHGSGGKKCSTFPKIFHPRRFEEERVCRISPAPKVKEECNDVQDVAIPACERGRVTFLRHPWDLYKYERIEAILDQT